MESLTRPEGAMNEHITVEKMVRDWLKSHGYNGLWTDFGGGTESCGCGLDDLCPCGDPYPSGCVAAHKHEDGLFYPVLRGVKDGNHGD